MKQQLQDEDDYNLFLHRSTFFIETSLITLPLFATFLCIEWHDLVETVPVNVLISIVTVGMVLSALLVSVTSRIVFFYWMLWIFWMHYSFGYYYTFFFVQTRFWILVVTIGNNLFYALSVFITLYQPLMLKISTFFLKIIFVLNLFVDIVPLEENNIFSEHYTFWILSRITLATVIATLLNLESNASHKEDVITRFLIRINYVLFGFSYLVLIAAMAQIIYVLVKERQKIQTIVFQWTRKKL